MEVTVNYVDGTSKKSPIEDWPILRGDGVDWVEVYNGGVLRVSSQSIYWIYPEGSSFVVGWGSVGYDPNPLTEVVCTQDGIQTERKIMYMPDLPHQSVKLGWWWPGKKRPANG